MLNSKLTAKELKRKQQAPWQPKQRAQFSQSSDQTRTPFVRGRGRGGRGRGRVVARNQAWVSGGVLTAGDFIGLHAKSMYDGSQFNADDDYSQLAESARNFAAASANSRGGYQSYQGYGTSGQVAGQSQALTQQGPKRGGGTTASTSGFTAYGSYATHGGTPEVQTPGQIGGHGRGRGFGTTRGGGTMTARGMGATASIAKPQASAVGLSAPPRLKFSASTNMGYGLTPQLVQQQSATRPLLAEQYATAIAPDSYTSAVAAGQEQQLYEAYGYECADTSAAYPQAAYYTAAGGQYLATDAGVPQFYSQF